MDQKKLQKIRKAAREATKSGDRQAAVAAWRRVLEQAGDEAAAADYQGLARALHKSGEAGAARELLQEALARFPSGNPAADLQVSLAELHAAEKDWVPAAREQARALELRERLEVADYVRRIEYLKHGGQEPEAQQALAALRAQLTGGEAPEDPGERPADEAAVCPAETAAQPHAVRHDAELRLQALGINWAGRRVLQFGCGAGELLFPVAQTAEWAVGLDADPQAVNRANMRRARERCERLDFYVFDPEREPLSRVGEFFRSGLPDLVLITLCSDSTKHWKPVVLWARALSPYLVYAASTLGKRQKQEREYLRGLYPAVETVWDRSADPEHDRRRKLFVCSADA